MAWLACAALALVTPQPHGVVWNLQQHLELTIRLGALLAAQPGKPLMAQRGAPLAAQPVAPLVAQLPLEGRRSAAVLASASAAEASGGPGSHGGACRRRRTPDRGGGRGRGSSHGRRGSRGGAATSGATRNKKAGAARSHKSALRAVCSAVRSGEWSAWETQLEAVSLSLPFFHMPHPIFLYYHPIIFLNLTTRGGGQPTTGARFCRRRHKSTIGKVR